MSKEFLKISGRVACLIRHLSVGVCCFLLVCSFFVPPIATGLETVGLGVQCFCSCGRVS